MPALEQVVSEIREDVGYIRAKIEVLPDHENRLRALESATPAKTPSRKVQWGGLGAAVLTALAAMLTSVFGPHSGS